MSTLDQIKEIIGEELGQDTSTLDRESDLLKDLDADSLDLFQVVTEIEDHFDIEMDEEKEEEIRTLGQLVDYIDELVAAK